MIKNVLYIFLNEKKFSFFLLFIFLIFISVLEVLSIGSIFPILNLLINQKKTNIEIIDELLFGTENLDRQSLIYFVIGVGLIFTFKNIFLGLFNWFSIKLSQRISRNLQVKLLKNYINIPLKNFLQTNSSLLMRNIDREPLFILKHYINPFFILIKEFFISFAIILLLIINFTKITIVIFLIFLAFIFPFYFFTKTRLKKLSEKRLFLIGKKATMLRESIELIRDIKIYNKFKFFVDRYLTALKKVNYINLNISIIGILPRLFVEVVLVIVGLLSIFISVFYLNIEMIDIIPSLALLGAALLKVIPSTIRIIAQYQKMESAKPSINLIYNIIKDIESYRNINNNNIPNKFKSINLKNISHEYEKENILENLNFEIHEGDFIILKGMSGSGKSTFLNILCGLIKPYKGEIIVNDKIFIFDRFSTAKFGYVGVNNSFIDGNLKENILLKSDKEIFDDEILKVKKALSIVQMENFVQDLTIEIGEKANKVSEGQKQRIAIARALISNPNILVFDEATNSIDQKTEQQIFNNIFENYPKITFIIVTHRELNVNKSCKKFTLHNKKLKRIDE